MSTTRRPFAIRLTPAGRGAIAVIEVIGDGLVTAAAMFQPANRRSWSEQPVGQLLYGRWGTEDVVVCRTAADRFEVHCHGGDAAVARILADLERCGIASNSGLLTPASEERVRVRGPDVRATPLQDELQTALSQALTARTADLLNEQLQGCLLTAFERLAEPDLAALEALLDWADFGLHLSQPWQVVLTGRPNVGKSSLINALLGYRRAIVAEQPGTTRDLVTAVTAFDGWPVQLADTAGLRATDSELEAAGIERAREALRSADLPVIVLDVGDPPSDADRALLATWPDALVIAHKSDRGDAWGPEMPPDALRVSSLSGAGLDELQREIARRLVPQVPPPGTPIPVTLRQVELLRQMFAACAAGDVVGYRTAGLKLVGASAPGQETGG